MFSNVYYYVYYNSSNRATARFILEGLKILLLKAKETDSNLK